MKQKYAHKKLWKLSHKKKFYNFCVSDFKGYVTKWERKTDDNALFIFATVMAKLPLIGGGKYYAYVAGSNEEVCSRDDAECQSCGPIFFFEPGKHGWVYFKKRCERLKESSTN